MTHTKANNVPLQSENSDITPQHRARRFVQAVVQERANCWLRRQYIKRTFTLGYSLSPRSSVLRGGGLAITTFAPANPTDF